MRLTGAAEARDRGLKGRGESLAQVARVQSGCSGLQSSSPCSSTCKVTLLVVLVDAERVHVLRVLQERPRRQKHAITLLAGEVGGLLSHWQKRWTKPS